MQRHTKRLRKMLDWNGDVDFMHIEVSHFNSEQRRSFGCKESYGWGAID